MVEKFSIDDLMIKIVPGGTLIIFILYIYNPIKITPEKGLDFFYTFVYFTLSFIVGEIIQTIAHLFERLFYIFFRFYKPSEIFLLQKNPIFGPNEKINTIVSKTYGNNNSIQEMSFKEIKFYKDKELRFKVQRIFNMIYSKVSQEPEIKIFNRGFLMVRGITLTFLIIAILFITSNYCTLSICSFLIVLIFFWRARGCSKKLVEKVTYKYLETLE